MMTMKTKKARRLKSRYGFNSALTGIKYAKI